MCRRFTVACRTNRREGPEPEKGSAAPKTRPSRRRLQLVFRSPCDRATGSTLTPAPPVGVRIFGRPFVTVATVCRWRGQRVEGRVDQTIGADVHLTVEVAAPIDGLLQLRRPTN